MTKRLGSRMQRFVQAQNETLDIEPIDVWLLGLPQALEGYRMAVVADPHMDQLRPYHDRILEAVYMAHPGCILLAGDSIDEYTKDVAALSPFFMRLARIAPTVAVLGNNDCDIPRTAHLRSMYEACGVTLLENETRMLRAGDTHIRITGLCDPRAIQLKVNKNHAESENEHLPMRQALPPERGESDSIRIPSILLLHRPHLAEQYASLSPSLIVAGHAHGGQFRLGPIGGVYSPGQGIFPRLTSGLYPIGGTQLLVSRGLGNHGFPLRLWNRPHIPVAVLRGRA